MLPGDQERYYTVYTVAQLVADVGCLGSVLFDFIDLSFSRKKEVID
jgi:hypothetical protein